MSNETILLKALQFTREELEGLLKAAIKLLYIDGEGDVDEWNIVSLLPALIEIEQEQAPPELKDEWKQKLESAGRIIAEQNPEQAVGELDFSNVVSERAKQEVFIIILFMVAFADNKLNQLELSFIINNFARPWNISSNELGELIAANKDFISGAEEIIQLLKRTSLF